MEQYVNDATGILASNINNSVTTVTVTDASLFPTQGNFRIRIDDELMKVTAVSGLDFTVERGDDGTTPDSHLVGATVKGVLTAGGLKKVVATRFSIDNYSSGLDAVNKDIHIETVSVCMFFSAYETIRPYGPIFRLSPVTPFSFSDFGSPDVSGGSGYQLVTGTTSGSTRIIGKTISYTSGTVVAGFLRSQVLKDISGLCFGVRNSSNSKMTHVRLSSPDNYATKLLITNSNGGTHTDIYDVRIHDSDIIWFKIVNTGTDHEFYVSFDNQIWTLLATYSVTAFHGGSDEAFWGVFYDSSSPVPIQATLLSWEQ